MAGEGTELKQTFGQKLSSTFLNPFMFNYYFAIIKAIKRAIQIGDVGPLKDELKTLGEVIDKNIEAQGNYLNKLGKARDGVANDLKKKNVELVDVNNDLADIADKNSPAYKEAAAKRNAIQKEINGLNEDMSNLDGMIKKNSDFANQLQSQSAEIKKYTQMSKEQFKGVVSSMDAKRCKEVFYDNMFKPFETTMNNMSMGYGADKDILASAHSQAVQGFIPELHDAMSNAVAIQSVGSNFALERKLTKEEWETLAPAFKQLDVASGKAKNAIHDKAPELTKQVHEEALNAVFEKAKGNAELVAELTDPKKFTQHMTDYMVDKGYMNLERQKEILADPRLAQVQANDINVLNNRGSGPDGPSVPTPGDLGEPAQEPNIQSPGQGTPQGNGQPINATRPQPVQLTSEQIQEFTKANGFLQKNGITDEQIGAALQESLAEGKILPTDRANDIAKKITDKLYDNREINNEQKAILEKTRYEQLSEAAVDTNLTVGQMEKTLDPHENAFDGANLSEASRTVEAAKVRGDRVVDKANKFQMDLDKTLELEGVSQRERNKIAKRYGKQQYNQYKVEFKIIEGTGMLDYKEPMLVSPIGVPILDPRVSKHLKQIDKHRAIGDKIYQHFREHVKGELAGFTDKKVNEVLGSEPAKQLAQSRAPKGGLPAPLPV
ncbi:MAG: hypothetical protein LBM38_01110 [Clostridiales bacterium]|jgi:hypothetical protein|nr:hypothetical protein [Clostridiales bacterium]